MSSASRRTPRVLAFGLEAAEPSLIERFCAEGELPTLTGLMRKGGYRRLLSTTDISSGSTWASVNTGVGPGKHGIGFYHRQLETGTYHIVKKYAEDVKRPPFWLDLAAGGERVAVIDVPETHVVPDMNGIQIVGWGAEALNAPAGSWPPDLFREIGARFGVHPLTGWYQARPATIEGWVMRPCPATRRGCTRVRHAAFSRPT